MMTFKLHHRVTFGGTLAESNAGAPDEIWACNVNVTGVDAEGFDEEAYLDSIAPRLATWFSSVDGHMSNEAALTYVKCNQVGPDGLYVDKTTTHRRDINPVAQGVAAPVDPSIISIAISWSTDKARGPGSHGRIYPPNATVGSSGQMFLTGFSGPQIATSGFQLLGILQNDGHAGPTLAPVVASKVNATNTQITGVRVGSVKDVQRRRKSALRETYSTLVFPPAVILIEN